MTQSVLHIYALDMSEAEVVAAGLAARVPGHAVNAEIAPAALIGLLGTDTIAPSDIEIFDVARLGGLTLSDYLMQGTSADAAQLSADRGRLDAIRGHVLIVHATTADGAALPPATSDPRLTLIGSYAEGTPPVRVNALADGDTIGTLPGGKPPKSDARIGGMVATVVLLCLGLFVFLLVWTAG